jgi:hypothetical protein
MEDVTPAAMMLAMLALIAMIKCGASRMAISITVVLYAAAAAIFFALFGLSATGKSALVVAAGIGATIAVNLLFRHLKEKRNGRRLPT